MRIGAHATIVTASVAAGAVGLIGSAFAADMTGAEIKAFLSGKTAYLETTAASATGTPGQGHLARQVGNQGQYAVRRFEGEAEQSVHALRQDRRHGFGSRHR